jgi:hypothetical protein
MDIDMHHGHGHAPWKWTCTIDMDMHHGHGHAMDMDMHHGDGYAPWTLESGKLYETKFSMFSVSQIGMKFFFAYSSVQQNETIRNKLSHAALFREMIRNEI